MPPTRAKAQETIDAVGFNTLIPLQFQPITLAASQPSTTVQARMWLPTAVKIYRVIAGLSGTVAGACSVNIVAGVAAELTGVGSLPTPDSDYAGQPAYPPPYPTAGQKLFLTDRPLTMTTELATIITPNDNASTGAFPANTPGFEWDAIWGPGGMEITVRTLTGAGATGTLLVTLLAKFYDPTYSKPILTSFNPAVDIV